MIPKSMKPPRDYEIRLLCPKCRRAMNVMRCQADPPKAAEVRIQCPECVGDQIAELSAALRDALQIADRRYASPLPDADWTLSAVDVLQAQLSVSLHRHVPGWPGATDEQLAAVAREIIDALDAIPGPSR